MDIRSRVLACMQCGKCTGSCPEAGITPFNIRMLMRKRQFKNIIDESLPWYCTSCGACTIRCPRDVKPSEVIIEMRSALVEDGEIPPALQKALENTFVQKNPWGRSRAKRGAWFEKPDIGVPHVSETSSKRLLFTCCIQAYDPRCMVIPQNISKILKMCGIEFGVLGEEEACCGNEIRRIGEVGLFEELQEENKATFEEYGIKEIIALSPHCMNALKKEYGDLGIKIYHYTELLAPIMRDGTILPKTNYNKKVIYHDPCFLGKQNGIFDEPRDILNSIDGLELLEFSRSRENSMCCEGGGGRMFFEVETSYRRNAEVRVSEAKEIGAEIIATSCPFCVMTLEEPAIEKGLEVKEISEILMEVL
ncbi:MAG TPA: (Fe-S)-binding protein [Syntrophorhabdaceae bacterium]|nr:(Fe-S)-binding protein [Syntrophorhabdaceae bacterium]HNZ59351.1 (Fe-S)-binding protein [Syntrophorhabdaceae bacterium]HOG40424.1 (Fe-S)-binding protein [Syntrophorhabdaceae bacterium]